MKLRFKFAGIFILTSIAICLLIAEGASVLLHKSYDTLEDRRARSDFHVVQNILVDELESFASILYHYGEWDAVYNYLNGTEKAPMSDATVTGTLQYTRMNFMAYFDTDGPELAVAIDENYQNNVPFDSVVNLDSPGWTELSSQFDHDFDMTGLVHAENGTFLISASPVRKSDGSGHYVGHILVGTRVNSLFIENLRQKMNIRWSFSVEGMPGLIELPLISQLLFDGVFDDDALNPRRSDMIATVSEIVEGEAGSEQQATKTAVGFYSEDGATSAELAAYSPRTIVAHGEATLNWMIIIIGFCLTTSLLALSFMLQKLFVSPVTRMSSLMRGSETLARLKQDRLWNRKDEIGDLFRSYCRLSEENGANIEELRDAAAKAEAASVSKSEFLANMSHEIRTPMNGVMGMAQVVQNTDLTEQQKLYVDTIYESGLALLTIINDILDFSKVESGKMELDPAPFSPRSAMEGVMALLKTQAQEKNIELIAELDEVESQNFVGDVGRIRQVVTNLLGNAIKFTSEGFVLLRVTSKAIDEHKTRLRFEIQDTGIGIPADKLNMIFEEFTQAEGSTTRQYGGTGLGLSISSRIINLMGSQIHVQSDYGHGSTFWFDIDLDNAVNAPLSDTKACDLDGRVILVVDDLEVNQRILQNQLSKWGAKVFCVSSAKKGLAVLKGLARRGSPTMPLVLTDYHMPNMDGLEFVRYIRNDPSLADLEIMVLSSADDSDTKSAFRALNVDVILPKPILTEDLIRVLTVTRQPFSKNSELPLNPAQARSRPAPKIEPQRRSRVLVAEDNAVNRAVIESMFQGDDYEIVFAHDGQEAVDALKVGRFGLVLMDISMPNMDGVEATKAIRSYEAKAGASRTPIIALTAHAMDGDRDRYMAAGMDDYCTKPIKQDVILEKVAEWVGSDRSSNIDIQNVA